MHIATMLETTFWGQPTSAPNVFPRPSTPMEQPFKALADLNAFRIINQNLPDQVPSMFASFPTQNQQVLAGSSPQSRIDVHAILATLNPGVRAASALPAQPPIGNVVEGGGAFRTGLRIAKVFKDVVDKEVIPVVGYYDAAKGLYDLVRYLNDEAKHTPTSPGIFNPGPPSNPSGGMLSGDGKTRFI